MKKILFLLIASTVLFSCTKSAKITVTNPSDIDRENEIVEFCLCSISKKLNMQEGDNIVIKDANNKQVPYQLLADGKTIIFPASVTANDSAVFSVMIGKPDSVATKTNARQVPERKDDFAWENDRIAFRMYGPALANENPSNGVDIWLKRTDELVMDKFYKEELENGKSYHVDHGQGLDCYKVGHALGAGGIAPYSDSTLWVGSHYNSFEVIDNGPLRSSFKLYYDSLKVDNNSIKATLTVSIDAGAQLNKASIIYEGENIDDIDVAPGIFLHDSTDNININKEKGYIAYAENAISDAGIPSGRNYIAAIVPSLFNEAKIQDKHLLAISDYTKARPFVYYFGGGWSKWGFDTDNDWFDYVEKLSDKISQPLRVSFK